jgi:hypothetical protein
MFLFTRSALLVGDTRAAMKWAAEMTAYVNDHTEDHSLSLWLTQFGAPVGSVGWSVGVESYVDLQATFAWLQDDDGYFAMLDAGAAFMAGPPVDHLRQLVAGTLGEPPAVGSLANVVTAVAANGKYADAMAWGAEISGYIASVTGQQELFFADSYGPFGQMTWVGIAPDMAAVDSGTAAMQGDAGYMQRLGAIGELFVSGSGHSALSQRVA